MGESLVQRLEQFSYYERLSEHGGEAERTVFIFRNIDIRGKAYHVLSRIKDAPADYTGRTNFIAQHLVFTPDEVANMPTPAVLLNHWSGWKDQWEHEPTLLSNESWTELDELKNRTFLPANHWFSETADHGRAAGLLGLNAGVFTAHDFKPKLILDLLSESLELLQLEGPNWRSLAWQRTFSVGCQPQDNPADFRWRFLTSGLPFESSVSQGRAPVELRRLRAPSNSQQVQFAQKGPSPPQFTSLPRAGEALQINEGETLILDGEALSLPGPSVYRWYRVEKDNVTLQEIDGAHDAQLEIPNPQRGKHRYKVRAWDSVTDQYAESPIIVVEVNEKVKIPSLTGRPALTSGPVSPSSRSSKPVSQPQLRKNVTLSNRTDENRLGDKVEEEMPPNFFQRYANTLLLSSVLLLVAVSTAGILKFMDFFAPHFKDHKRDWWALTVTKDPLSFEKSLRIPEQTRKDIADYRKTIGSTNTSTGVRDHLLNKIRHHLTSTDADNPARNDSPSKNKVRPREPVSGQPKNTDKPVKQEPVKKLSGPIYVILADNEWRRLIKSVDERLAPLKKELEEAEATRDKAEATLAKADKQLAKADEQLAKMHAVERAVTNCAYLKKRVDLLDSTERIPLLNRRKRADQLQDHNSWPYFPTNISPTLRWSELGKLLPENGNEVSGEWRTNDWNFKTENWTLQISELGAVYQSTKPPSAILVSIASEENAAGTNQLLRLLLFSAGISNRFSTTLVGDDLKPNTELQELLSSLALANNNALRVMGSYPSAKNPMSNTLTEINAMNSRNEPWNLGIKAQLAEKAAMLNQVQKAFARLDTFWIKVAKENKLALRVEDFSTAVDPSSNLYDEHLRKAFWEKLDLLCLVSVYKRVLHNKAPELEEKDKESAKKILLGYIEAAGDGGSQFKEDLMQLTADLSHFQYFWKTVYEEKNGKDKESLSFKAKSYRDVKANLAQLIEKLESHGGTIEPANLRITLEFQAFGTNWIPITRLDARIP